GRPPPAAPPVRRPTPLPPPTARRRFPPPRPPPRGGPVDGSGGRSRAPGWSKVGPVPRRRWTAPRSGVRTRNRTNGWTGDDDDGTARARGSGRGAAAGGDLLPGGTHRVDSGDVGLPA